MVDYIPERDGLWWEADQHGREPHDIIEPIVLTLRNKHSYRRIQARRNALYYGVDMALLGAGSSVGQIDAEIYSVNAAQNVIDTVVCKTAKSRVLPQATTDEGTYAERHRVKRFNAFIEGLFSHCRIYARDAQWCTDCLLFDAGVAKVFEQDGEVVVDRVYSWDIEVDHTEARYGKPYSMYQTYLIDRGKLRSMYKGDPEKVKAIDRCISAKERDDVFAADATSDMVTVREAWRLPTREGAGDGKWARTIAGCTLEFDPYEDPDFPFVFLYEKRPLVGVWQRPFMSDILPSQVEYDKINRRIQEAIDIIGVPRLLIPNGANIRRGHITDETGGMVYYDGPTAPTEWNPTPVTPEVFQYRNQIPSDMMTSKGVNQMSANGQIPRGMEGASGRALQVLDDVESERLGIFWRCREEFYIQIANKMLDVARQLSRDNPDFDVMAPSGRKTTARVKFKDVDIEKDRYTLQVFATNLLSKMPAARYEQLMEMRANGDISPQTFKRELGNPDLDAELALETAPDDLVDAQIKKILVDGEEVIVEPTDPHALIVQRGTLALSKAKLDGEDREDWERLLRYVQSAQTYLSEQEREASAAAAASQAATGALDPTLGALTPAQQVPLPQPQDPVPQPQ